MDKADAIREILRVQSPVGYDRSAFPEEMKGQIAKDKWHDADFSYGMEYGYMWGMMRAFDITPADLAGRTLNIASEQHDHDRKTNIIGGLISEPFRPHPNIGDEYDDKIG